MAKAWRYVQATRGHALETAEDYSAKGLVSLVEWLQQSSIDTRYQLLHEYHVDGLKWLVASGSKKKRRFQSDEVERGTVLTAMWLGKVAYHLADTMERAYLLQTEGGYRQMTGRMASAAWELYCDNPSQSQLKAFIPDARGYRPWDQLDDEWLEEVASPWFYDLGY